MAQSYFVKLRIVEVKDIKPVSTTQTKTLPNPYIEVEVCDEVQRTPVAEETSTCVWNASLLFSNIRLSPVQLKRLEARIVLRSANVLVRDDVLGCVTLELSSILNQSDSKGHLPDSWFAISDPQRPERIVAYLRIEAWVGLTGSVVESVATAQEGARQALSDAEASLDPSGALSPTEIPDVSLVPAPPANPLMHMPRPPTMHL